MVLVKNRPIFNLFLLGNLGHKNVFYVILNRENTSLRYKNKNLKKWKNRDFSKGVSPWFLSEIGQFSNFFLCKIGS